MRHYCHSNFGSETNGHQLVETNTKRVGLRLTVELKGSGLYLTKWGCDEITSSMQVLSQLGGQPV